MEWIEDTSQFDEDFIKNYNEESDAKYFLEADVQYLEKLNKLHKDLPILLEILKLKKSKSLWLIYINLNMINEKINKHMRNFKQKLNQKLALRRY